ncbi:MAG TPA: hypothetical protein VMW48_19480 [Vicinamibacterales bacterium]|nr:hypothetical protein [Vicinamibacterales bacterium]
MALAIFLIEALAFQWVGGAFSTDYASTTSDEAAHFVTALMVRDYLASDALLHPWSFARDYYLHYPKVAIGHWPPGFYGALSVWLLAVGATRTGALVFMALLAAGLSCVTFAAGAVLIAPWAGWFAGAAFVALPLAREATGQVMAEHAAGLLMLLGALQFARSVGSARFRDWAYFGIIAAAAILTSGSSWALALLPALFILLTGRFDLLGSTRMWSAALVVLALCVPWYVFSLGITAGEDALVGGGLSYVRQAVVALPMEVLGALGPVVVLLAAVGAWDRLLAVRSSRQVDPMWAALAALVVAKLLLHVVVQAGLEPRYVLAGVPSLLLLAAAGIDRMAGAFDGWTGRALVRPGLAVFAMAAAMFQGAAPGPPPSAGYTAAAAAVAASFGGAPQVYLIASDSRGEGSWIAGIAIRERRPASFVLRGSKVFVDEDWLGRNARERVASVAEVVALLDRVPVTVVVIDLTTSREETREYHARLAAAMRADASAWEQLDTFPLRRFGRSHANGLQVFRRRAVPAPPDVAFIAGLVLRDGLR